MHLHFNINVLMYIVKSYVGYEVVGKLLGLTFWKGNLKLFWVVSSLIWAFQMKKEKGVLMKFPDQMQGKCSVASF